MRTESEIKADAEKLVKEITAIIDTMGDTGAPELALYAVLDARPDLKTRWDSLMAESRELEPKAQKPVANRKLGA